MHTCVGAYTYYLLLCVHICCFVVQLSIIMVFLCCFLLGHNCYKYSLLLHFSWGGGWVWSLSSFCILTIVFSRSTCGLGAGGCGARIVPVVLVYFRSRVTRRGVYFYDGPHITKPSNPSDDTRHQIVSKSRKTMIYESCPSTCPKL